MQTYSAFFQTLHDEAQPTGYLGRGSHYSVLRAITWHGSNRQVLKEAHYLDFAVICDEDHDTRAIHAIELLYKRGLLSSAIIVGERKAGFTFLMPDDVYASLPALERQKFQIVLNDLMQSLEEDPWNGHLGSIRTDDGEIINDKPEKVHQYLRTIEMLWQLGVKSI